MGTDSPHYHFVDDDSVNLFDSPGTPVDIDEGMTSGQETPQSSKGKKRVGWSLPHAEDPEEEEEQKLSELRREISLAIPDADGPSLDPSSLMVPRPPPRSVLRSSGSSTPQNGTIAEEIDDGVADLDTKRRSATDAQFRANRLNDDVSRSTSPTNRQDQRRRRQSPFRRLLFHSSDQLDSGATTPEEVDATDHDWIPKPPHWRAGGLSEYLVTRGRHLRQSSVDLSNLSSPRRSPDRSPGGSITEIMGSSSPGASIGVTHGMPTTSRHRRPGFKRSGSEETLNSSSRPNVIRSASSSLVDLRKLIKPITTPSPVDPVIKEHVEETALRHKFLIRLCRALMWYGAPTHRIEEYMKATARCLETEAQFLYIPGCMIISFDDSRTHTTEVKLVRVNQGVDLGKLRDTHDIYKDVIHDHVGVNEAAERLEEIMARKLRHPRWLRTLAYGVASVCVGPFAFGARFIDLPMAFILGLIVGGLQLYVATRSDLYANIFEILAVLITSFLARWWGSLRDNELFCFPALAQAAIALILPGYTVLCGALELQAKSIVAGSVRMVYAIIYSLFLGFALTMGTALYAVIDDNASSQTVCKDPLSGKGKLSFLFVPPFGIALMIINQAKWKQMPVMTIIAIVGYLANFYSAARFTGNPQVSSAVGAFAIAALANLYSRISLDEAVKSITRRVRRTVGKPERPASGRSSPTPSTMEHDASANTGWRLTMYRILHFGKRPPGIYPEKSSGTENLAQKKGRINYSLAASAMLPAIFVQVPSGLSVSGSLVQGIATSNQLISNGTGSTLTAGDVYSGRYGNSNDVESSIAFTVGYSVVQVAIGITVGLFLGTLTVYPLGKTGKRPRSTRGALFSF